MLPGVEALEDIETPGVLYPYWLFQLCRNGHLRLRKIVDLAPVKALEASEAHPPQHHYPSEYDHTVKRCFELRHGSSEGRAVLRVRGSPLPVPALPPIVAIPSWTIPYYLSSCIVWCPRSLIER